MTWSRKGTCENWSFVIRRDQDNADQDQDQDQDGGEKVDLTNLQSAMKELWVVLLLVPILADRCFLFPMIVLTYLAGM